MSNSKHSGMLTTHVLDTANGKPAEGLNIHLYRISSGQQAKLKTVATNDDGRCDAPVLSGSEFEEGEYELVFEVGDYFADTSGPVFLQSVPVRFTISDTSQHYHVPLLVSPYGYTTYRGS